jgi:hypothetical protein
MAPGPSRTRRASLAPARPDRIAGGGRPAGAVPALYRGGYSLLLLPAHWLGGGPLSQYHRMLFTNALLSALVFPLVHVLLTRVFRVPARLAATAAFLAALYLPLVVTTQFAWPESVLPALVLVAAITLAAVVTASRPRAAAGWAIACGGCAGAVAGRRAERGAGRRLRRRRLLACRPLRLPVAVGARPLRAVRLPPGPGSPHRVGHRRAGLAAGAEGRRPAGSGSTRPSGRRCGGCHRDDETGRGGSQRLPAVPGDASWRSVTSGFE